MIWCAVCWHRMFRKRVRRESSWQLAVSQEAMRWRNYGKRDLWGGIGAGGERDVDGAGWGSSEFAVAGDGHSERLGGTVGVGRSRSAERNHHAGRGHKLADGKPGPDTKN